MLPRVSDQGLNWTGSTNSQETSPFRREKKKHGNSENVHDMFTYPHKILEFLSPMLAYCM